MELKIGLNGSPQLVSRSDQLDTSVSSFAQPIDLEPGSTTSSRSICDLPLNCPLAIQAILAAPFSSVTRPASISLFKTPIDVRDPGRLAGFSRNWGDASHSVQVEIIRKIIHNSSDLSLLDQSLLVAIARVESGFNPDAAAHSTSAAGVFQLVRNTAQSLGLASNMVFDAEQNISAGVQLYRENLRFIDRRYGELPELKKAALLYALHHDGPSLMYGGQEIAAKKIIPLLEPIARAISQLS